jgi:hypothetical protein
VATFSFHAMGSLFALPYLLVVIRGGSQQEGREENMMGVG